MPHAAGQMIVDLGAAFSGVLVNIGRRLALYKSMAQIGACTSGQLAEVTGVRERYVREWLNNQAAGGCVRYEPEGSRYSLPAAQAMVLAVEDSPVYMASEFEVAAAFWLDEVDFSAPKLRQLAETARAKFEGMPGLRGGVRDS